MAAPNFKTNSITFNGTKFEKAVVDPLRKQGPGSYPVSMLGQTDLGGRIGRTSLNMAGTLTLTSTGWTFVGDISSFTGSDTYNFNSGNRGWFKETLVTFGQGLTYVGITSNYVQGLTGTAPITGTGH